jgi:hemerythrin-like domain-containing protein
MRALQVLATEHAAIAACCARFEAELDAIVGHGEADAEALDRLLTFFEVQVDGHHQEKEERIFLPRLLARASGEDVALLRSLLDDHGAQRKLLAHMRNQIEGVAYGEPNSVAVLVRAAQRYLRAQREHSHWEQTVLFSAARRILGPRDDRAILNGFRRIDELWSTTVWDAERALAEWLDQRRALVSA